MALWLKGTGRYLLAQIAGTWLWFCLFFIYILLAAYLVNGFGFSIGRALLILWIGANIGGMLILRAIAHKVGRHSEQDRDKAVAAGEFVAEFAVALTDDDAILYGAGSSLPEWVRRTLLGICAVLVWACYAGIGFTLCVTVQGLRGIAVGSAEGNIQLLDLCRQCWVQIPGLRIYVIAGAIICAHVLVQMSFQGVRDRMDRFILGPWYAAARRASRTNKSQNR